MRVLIIGAGVIGTVYAAKLIEAGNDVTLVARGDRLRELQTSGIMLEDAESARRTTLPVRVVGAPDPADRPDVVLVAVRAEQLSACIPMLSGLPGGPDVLLFGNTAGHARELIDALGGRAMLGFPAAGGVKAGPLITYVLISQQKTMVGEPDGHPSARVRALRVMFSDAGFPARISRDMEGWLVGHAAFITPIACALYAADTDPARLAADPAALRVMVRATRQAFKALQTYPSTDIPTNLKVLYLRMPTTFAVRYWRRVMAGPHGELWFAAHSRAARAEITAVAYELQAAVHRTGRPCPDLDALVAIL